MSGQRSPKGQFWQVWGLAVQKWRPWRISIKGKSTQCSLGTMAIRSCSILTGSLESDKPKRLDMRIMWVSMMMPAGFLKAQLRTTLAVFLATPGRESRSSILSGTWPLYLSTIICEASLIVLDLVLWKFILAMYLSKSSLDALAIFSAVG